jgi:amino acid adenylation domain-containing protein
MVIKHSIIEIANARAASQGELPAYVFLSYGAVGLVEERLTYAELDARARAVGAFLQEAGAAGERVALLISPGLEFIVSFFGCLYAGAIAVPGLPPRQRGADPRLRAIFRDACPRIALTSADKLPALEKAAAEIPELRAALRRSPPVGTATEWRLPNLDPDALAFLQYTSGSTSSPRGVMVSHGNLLHNEELIRRTFEQSAESVVLGWLPLHHDMGLIGTVLQPLYLGATCYLMSPGAFLQRPARWLEAISRYRATTSGGPNFAYELCLRKVPAAERATLDLSSWRVAFNGAEPVRADTLRRFSEAFAPCGFRAEAFRPCYGLAEATLLVSGWSPGEARSLTLDADALADHRVAEVPKTLEPENVARHRELVGCGAAMQTVLVVDSDSRLPCPPDRVGEVWIAGPSVARGYWGRPEETAATFGARLADGEGPFLRTGDLGFLSGGELFLTGRLKDLVILRGRNHYPQDLELTAERSHADLRPGGGATFSVEIEGEERLVLVHEVTRHARASVDEIAATVRRAVAEEHGVSVADLILIRPETLPRTSSGKVRRHACREAWRSGSLSVVGRSLLEGQAAQTFDPEAAFDAMAFRELGGAGRRDALESFLRERAAAVLHLAQVPAGAPLSALGLDSLSAAELKAEVEETLGVCLPFAELLGGASAADLVGTLEVLLAAPAAGAGPPSLESAAGTGHGLEAPLSFGQKALWYLYQLAPESPAYTLAGAARLPAQTDPGALGRAVQRLTDRHDALRATFQSRVDGSVQLVPPRAEAAFIHRDASSWSGEELHHRLSEEAFRPFDLERGPVFRTAFFTRPDAAYLVLSVHHAVADFWSLAVMVRELGALYEGRELPPLSVRSADHVLWQEQAAFGPWGDRQWSFWRERLAGALPLELPSDRPRPPVQTFRGAVRRIRFGPEVAQGLGAMARRSGGTPFMVLLAGFSVLLSRWSGQEDFVVGSPTSGRLTAHFGDRLADLVGYLVNPVPLRTDTAGDPPVAMLLGRIRQTALEAFENQDFPFALLAERLRPQREAGSPPIFRAMLTLQKSPAPDLQALAAFALGEPGARLTVGGLDLESVALETPGAPLDLTLMAAELDGDLAASLQFNTDLFDAATAERMLDHLGNLLRGMMLGSEPGHRLSRLPLFGAAEQAQLTAWNETGVPWELETTLHARIAEQAERTPEAVAVEGEDSRLTYRDLLDQAHQLAGTLRSLRVKPESLVGIAAERSPEMVIGLLGILLAGGAYVPVDPGYPRERQELMLTDSRVRVLLTQRHLLSSLPDSGAVTLCLDAPETWEGNNLPGTMGSCPDNSAYVIYTSGSTGRPKGVVNTHRAIVNRLLWMQKALSLTPADRVLQKTPTSFDVSVWELFWPLLVGARLVLARPGEHQDPRSLMERIAASGVTTLHFVPSMLQAFLDEPGLQDRGSLRRVIVSGEALSGELARRFHTRFGAAVELHNLYGPTEAAVDVTWWSAGAESGARPVPIGHPVANTRIHLLDVTGCEVPVGVAGELNIGGVQLARGYWRRPDLTAERFVPDPLGSEPGGRLYRTGDLARRLPGGAVDFLGRLDHQIKLRGFRIELGEVEAALRACPEIHAAVAGVLGTGSDARLAAWVVPAPGETVSVRALREALAQRLPALFVPSLFAMLPALPLTPNGKVDRKALPDPEAAGRPPGAPYVGPRTPVEETLTGIWQELLGIERIGVDDHFFDLGGHSLLATRLMARVRDTFAVNFPLSTLFETTPTIAGLAQAMACFQVDQADEDDLASALLELDGLSEEQIRALLASEAG